MAEASVAAPAESKNFKTHYQRVSAILLGSAGNLIEWFDVYAYTAFALYFAGSFFPKDNPVVQQLNAAALFALAYLARPFGGLLFGYLADKHGRRNALTYSVLLMCFGSFLIAVCPTYAQIGIWAPVVLLIARVLQGLSTGGEYGTSSTYLAEVATPETRGFYSGVWYMTLIGGQLLAVALLFFLQNIAGLSKEDLTTWGWRIPFAIGALMALYTFVMRTGMAETDLFEEGRKVSPSTTVTADLWKHWRELLLVVGITIGGTSAFYTYTTYMQKFLKLSVGLSDKTTTYVTFAYLLVAICLQPIYGAISDRVGRKPMLIFFGVMGTACTYLLLSTVQNTKDPVLAFVLICAAWAIVSGYTAITAIVKAELFPTRIRALGVGLPYALTVSIFGGSVDSVALWFKSIGFESGFFWYATACIFISLLTYLFMSDTKANSRMNDAV